MWLTQRGRVVTLFSADGFLECFPGRLEQQIGQLVSIGKCHRGQNLRQREHNLVILDPVQQQLRRTVAEVSPLGSTAGRTVPVAAGVVDFRDPLAVVTLVPATTDDQLVNV